MLRLTSFKVGLLSVLGSFMLLLSLFAFTGTASAYTIDNGHPITPLLRPQLSASVVGQTRSASIVVRVSGSGFRPGVVFLSATAGRRMVSVQPMMIRTNRFGSFSQLVRIQIPDRSHATQIVLHATGQFGRASAQVFLFSSWYHQPFFGR